MAKKCKKVFKPSVLKIVGSKVVKRTKDWMKLLQKKIKESKGEFRTNPRKKALLQSSLFTAKFDVQTKKRLRRINRYQRQIQDENTMEARKPSTEENQHSDGDTSKLDSAVAQIMENLGHFLSEVQRF